MIGLTLVTVVAVLGAGLRTTVESAVTDQVSAAYVVDGTDGAPFEAAEGDALARVPGVKTASHVRNDKALVGGEEQRRHRRRPGDDRAASTRSTGPTAPTPRSPGSARTARW